MDSSCALLSLKRNFTVALYCALCMHIILQDPRPYIHPDILNTASMSCLTPEPRTPFMIVVATLTSMPTATLYLIQLYSPCNTTFVLTISHRGQATIDIFGTRNLFRFQVNITRMPNNGRITEDSISRVVKPAVSEKLVAPPSDNVSDLLVHPAAKRLVNPAQVVDVSLVQPANTLSRTPRSAKK